MIPVEIVDAADPDAPNRTIRRARLVDPLRALDLPPREWAAALRLRDDHDLATGYREDEGDTVRVDRSPGGGAHYTDVQLDALRRMATVSMRGMLMTSREWDVVQCVVLQWLPLDAVAPMLRMRRADVPHRLRAGLAGLVEFYG